MMLRKIASVSILSLGACSSLLLSSPALASRHCKDVYLKVVNNTGNQIKVIDLDYYDPAYQKWRSEPVPNEVIPDGQVWQETRRLEKVNEKNIRIRVEYRIPDPERNGGWSREVLTKESSRQVCSPGKVYEITLG
ncbi:hypothetical protein cce_0035 [Crocosphaera subtropica ATCC 51142]|uniref:Uncharacterized protein n=1 Tax=Crocosphaera subtropica (strain ATCC 51142 / BH68) TaxID=43989 RepID=B1WYF7_CROS5|nr:hypothetical protein [Crocosphaera subtropica]ACB49387.1 hypothetical protein cce_0035 [Crocosphaera subtropica ATCC 51142]